MKWLLGIVVTTFVLAVPISAIAASSVGHQHCRQHDVSAGNPPGYNHELHDVTHESQCGTTVTVDPIYVF